MLYTIADLFLRMKLRQRVLLMFLVVLTSLASVIEIVGIVLVFPLIRLLQNPDIIHDFAALQRIYDLLGFSDERYFVWAFGGLVLGIFCVKNLYITGVTFLQQRVASRATMELSRLMQRRFLMTPYLQLMKRNTAELIRIVRQVVPQVYSKVVLGVVNLVAEALVVLGIALLLLWIEPLATVAVAGVVGILYLIQYHFFGRQLQRWGKQTQGVGNDAYKRLNEAFRAVQEVRVLGREEQILNDLGDIYDRDIKMSSNRQSLHGLIRPMSEIVMLSAIFLVMTIVLLSSAEPAESLPNLAVFAVAGIRLLPTLNRLFIWLGDISSGAPPTRKVLLELDRTKSAGDHPQPCRRLAFKHSIQLDKLKFRYPKARRAALFPTDAVIRRGEFAGIVGPSGAGKSTLMRLILCLFTPTSGRLLIDGQDVANDSRGWQNNIGFVPQSIYLIDDTLRRNVALGIPDEDIDDDRIREVLRLASLSDVVGQLPDGLDSSLGEEGVNLSGGQRQRVGIARALYHDPEVLVLDEATAGLDYEIEYTVTQMLKNLKGKKTIIVIAHRLSVVADCDTLFFMNKGRIVDRGSYDELYAKNLNFRRLAELGQMKGTPVSKLAPSA
ncbi:ABC transporter ATP-binding protein [Pseudomonadota bacterium]